MGQSPSTHEISVEEQEQFEMQVEELYNPSFCNNAVDAKQQYMDALKEGLTTHMTQQIRNSVVPERSQKPQLKGHVKYVFADEVFENQDKEI